MTGPATSTMSRLLRRIVSAYGLVGVNGAAQLASAAVFALSARALGSGNFGREATVLSVSVTATSVLELGVNARVVRMLAAGDIDVVRAHAMATGKTFVTSVGAALVVAVAVVSTQTSWWSGVFAVLYAAGMQHSQSMQAILRAQHRLWAAVLLVGLDKLVALSVVGGWAVVGIGATGMWTSLVAGVTCAAFVGAIVLGRTAVTARVCHPYRGGSAFAVASVATGLQPLDVALAGLVAGPGAAGVYAAVSRWTAPLLLLPVSVGQMEAPKIAAAPSHSAAWRIVSRSGWLVTPTIGIAAVGVLGAPWLVSTVLGAGYAGSVMPLRLLLVGVATGAMGQLLLVFLQGRGYERSAARVFSGVVAVQFLAIAGLGHWFGATGVAMAMALANAAVSLLMYAAGRRHVREARHREREGEYAPDFVS